MKVVVKHGKTREEAKALVDKYSDKIFDIAPGGPVKLTDQKKQWDGDKMDFSLTASLGFVSFPITGFTLVDDTNVTVYCELPPMVKKLVSEDSIAKGIEKKVQGMLAPPENT